MKKSPVLRAAVFAIGLGVSSAASAFGFGDRVLATGFGVNESLGRAWIQVEYTNQMHEDVGPRISKVAIEGLRYDVENQVVVQTVGGQEVICAEARERGFGPFRNTWMAPTGDCPIATSETTATIDNGFTVREVPKLVVELNVIPANQVVAGTSYYNLN